MIELRPFATLGAADHGWLKAKHHFSFGSHYDPNNMGHGSLRVWNDDEIAPNTGFPAHPQHGKLRGNARPDAPGAAGHDHAKAGKAGKRLVDGLHGAMLGSRPSKR